MSQHTMSQLASLASRPAPAADTLAHYQASPLPTINWRRQRTSRRHWGWMTSWAVSHEWSASLDPSPDVIHIDMRSPSRNSYLGGRGWATTLWRDLHPMTPGSVIVASVGSGPQLPHTDVATHPEVLPPSDREVGDCHLSSFLCL